mmetsp:Transcript_72918/g.195742  ORF Transcript_72918/g.195742 Transcript_72918/m.195742 type:complete len:234 (+) Transcript_72918:522-1223(+)
MVVAVHVVEVPGHDQGERVTDDMHAAEGGVGLRGLLAQGADHAVLHRAGEVGPGGIVRLHEEAPLVRAPVGAALAAVVHARRLLEQLRLDVGQVPHHDGARLVVGAEEEEAALLLLAARLLLRPQVRLRPHRLGPLVWREPLLRGHRLASGRLGRALHRHPRGVVQRQLGSARSHPLHRTFGPAAAQSERRRGPRGAEELVDGGLRGQVLLAERGLLAEGSRRKHRRARLRDM